MDLKFTVSGRIAKSVDVVYEAVADPAQLSKYFTTGGAKGRIETGATVTWDFHDFPGAFPVRILAVEKNRRIELRWGAAPGTADADESGEPSTKVTLEFEQLDDGRTLVKISEEGWAQRPEGLAASYKNCEGWTGMLCAMKAWLEYGVQFRQGFYK